MKISSSNIVTSQKAAVELAASEAGLTGITEDIVKLFETTLDKNRFDTDSERAINAALKNRYGGKATWDTTRWLIPMPKLHYQSKDTPQLNIEITAYAVATARVRSMRDIYRVSLVGTIGKPETLTLLMVFLDAFLENDLSRFSIVAKDGNYTTWEVPGAKPVRVPNSFLSCLDDELYSRSVADWLAEFGPQGSLVAPLVAGSLLGLAFRESAQACAVTEELMTTDNLVSALESMAYQPTEAKEMVRKASAHFTADMTLEEAIKVALQKGGN